MHFMKGIVSALAIAIPMTIANLAEVRIVDGLETRHKTTAKEPCSFPGGEQACKDLVRKLRADLDCQITGYANCFFPVQKHESHFYSLCRKVSGLFSIMDSNRYRFN